MRNCTCPVSSMSDPPRDLGLEVVPARGFAAGQRPRCVQSSASGEGSPPCWIASLIMPTSLFSKVKAIAYVKVKWRSPPGARNHDPTGLHPRPSQFVSSTAEYSSSLQPLRPAFSFHPLPARIPSGSGPLCLAPGHRLPSRSRPGPPSASGAFSLLLLTGLRRNQAPAASSWLPAIPGTQNQLIERANDPALRNDSPPNRRVIKKPRFLMRANRSVRERLRRSILAAQNPSLAGITL